MHKRKILNDFLAEKNVTRSKERLKEFSKLTTNDMQIQELMRQKQLKKQQEWITDIQKIKSRIDKNFTSD